MPRVGDVHSLRSLAFVHTSHRMAHKVLLASLGAGDYSSASIVVPFSVYTMPKRKAKGTAAGGTSAVVCCICSTLRCLPAGTAKRRAAVQEAESASAKKLSKEEAFFRKLQYTRDAVNSRDRFARGAVLDEDLEGAIAWISSQAPHEVRCNSSRAPFLFALVIHLCGAGQCDKNHDHGRYRG